METDPTVAHATATEIEAGDATVMNGGSTAAVESITSSIGNVQVADDAANAVAESQWDPSHDTSISQEWVQVPREATETDSGSQAAPVAAANTQSWADDHPEPQVEVSLGFISSSYAHHLTSNVQIATPAAPADPNDGFHQVQRNRGRNEREGGNQRGRGRGEWRGRGHRGDGRGRGRGNRNAGGAPRGNRRNEES